MAGAPYGIRNLPRSISSGVQVQPNDVANSLKQQYRTIQVSFEAGETGTFKFYVVQAMTVQGFRGQVSKALAATDSGTVTFQNAAGVTMTGNAVWTIPASTAVGVEVNNSQAITGNNTIAAGSFFQVITAKTTPGGKAYLTIELVPT